MVDVTNVDSVEVQCCYHSDYTLPTMLLIPHLSTNSDVALNEKKKVGESVG